MITSFLHSICSGGRLSREEARQAMDALLTGNTQDVHIAAFLIALRMRGETASELAGFLDSLREHMTRVPCPDPLAVDLCGTGGDGSHSFNLSTAAALVAAAGGVTVAKHGNRAVSSRSGSADFLEALSIPIHANGRLPEHLLKEDHFAFLFAPDYHPAAKTVAPVRKALGVRTVFNLLGPLANPAAVKRQLVGVFDETWLEPVVHTLALTGSDAVMAVHAASGLDEISAEGETLLCELRDGSVTTRCLTPEALGVTRTPLTAIAGGNAEENAARFRQVAEGKEPELREWIVANAAPAFFLSRRAATLKEGAALAREAIASGRLRRLMARLASNEGATHA